MNERFRIFFYYLYKIGLYVFAVIGFVLVGGFFSIRFHLTDVNGIIDKNSYDFEQKAIGAEMKNDYASENGDNNNSLESLNEKVDKLLGAKKIRAKNLCSIDIIGKNAPLNAQNILKAFDKTNNDIIASKMIFAAELRLRESVGKDEIEEKCGGLDGEYQKDFDELKNEYRAGNFDRNIFPWMNDEEWNAIQNAVIKDKDAIDKVSQEVGIESRLLVSNAIVEQVRLFHSNRELFKKFFEPLKILGNANKISLGIMGIKEATAVQIENNLKDKNSQYYLGEQFENLLDYEKETDNESRYGRLTDEKNHHYYNYLYGALYLKEMMTQWRKDGYEIKYRPEIVGTLFNVGFPQSKPNANPKVGGSSIDVGDAKYSFGSLAYEFYYSGELLDEFPYVTSN